MALCFSPGKEVEGQSRVEPNWLELPRDVAANILQRVGVVEIVTSACLVCPLWWNICKDPLMWRTIHMTSDYTFSYDLVKICMYAIDRSCGQVENINIEYFGNDDLLQYIADSTSCLRSLRLAKFWKGISNKGLSAVVKKLPLLEEFDFTLNNVSTDTIEAIGRGCPLLKSLSFVSSLSSFFGSDTDDQALAIAHSMPGLRHLKFSNILTNVGMLAILDGCPLLESLECVMEVMRLRYHLSVQVDLHENKSKSGFIKFFSMNGCRLDIV